MAEAPQDFVFEGDEPRLVAAALRYGGQRLADAVRDRLAIGAPLYGALSLEAYARDPAVEAGQESIDRVVYKLIDVVRGRLPEAEVYHAAGEWFRDATIVDGGLPAGGWDHAAQLSSVQARCSELLEETRAARAQAAAEKARANKAEHWIAIAEDIARDAVAGRQPHQSALESIIILGAEACEDGACSGCRTRRAAEAVISAKDAEIARLRAEAETWKALAEAAEKGAFLPGWKCHACGCFNGTAKEDLRVCRACDAPKLGSAA